MIALELPVVNVTADLANANNYFDRVARALEQAELNGGPDMVARIEALLDDYDSQLAAFSASAQSGQGSLIKADVLEWSPGAVHKNAQAELARVRTQLARLLGLDGLMSRGSGRVRLVRG